MILNRRSGSNQSQTMEALVPMVDLFAVLAIVFMIHSNEEITVTNLEKQEIVARLEAIDEAERARRDRREFLAKKASKSLEQIKEERERKAQELLTQFTEMLAAQQSQAAMEYEGILARIEYEHEEELKKEVISLGKEKQAELETTKAELPCPIGVSDQDHQDQPAVANGCDLSSGQKLGLVLSHLGTG